MTKAEKKAAARAASQEKAQGVPAAMRPDPVEAPAEQPAAPTGSAAAEQPAAEQLRAERTPADLAAETLLEDLGEPADAIPTFADPVADADTPPADPDTDDAPADTQAAETDTTSAANEPAPDAPAPAPIEPTTTEPAAAEEPAVINYKEVIEKLATNIQMAIAERDTVMKELDHKIADLRCQLRLAERGRARSGQ